MITLELEKSNITCNELEMSLITEKNNILLIKNFIRIARVFKFFAALLITLELHNHFDSPSKLFSNPYLLKFFNILVESFFPYRCGSASVAGLFATHVCAKETIAIDFIVYHKR